ncbi:hypothetical protein FA13DRAFT_1727260 [Coprinellus micaceus]|uniref:Uncharacterized protein n=1 Tax=Coprinellus micaceus TaxID=71717 RepID=A0A4Y7TRS5_COPMI|nr:hypothetical protein FA13DRAFT_1727260 [Coprinellus micaceus]
MRLPVRTRIRVSGVRTASRRAPAFSNLADHERTVTVARMQYRYEVTISQDSSQVR